MTFQAHGPLYISTTLLDWTHTFTNIVASSSRNHRSHYVAFTTQPCFVASRFYSTFTTPISVIHCPWGAYLDANLSAMTHCIDSPILSTCSNNLVSFRPHGLLSFS